MQDWNFLDKREEAKTMERSEREERARRREQRKRAARIRKGKKRNGLDGEEKSARGEKLQLPRGLRWAIVVTKWVLMFVLPAAAFYLMEGYEHNPFEEVREAAQWYNILLFELLVWILFFVTGRARWALQIVWFLAMVFGLTNHYVMEFRSTPFVPWDIYSVRTAASVAGNYDFTPSRRVLVITLIFVAAIVSFWFMDLRLFGAGEDKGQGRLGRFVWMWRFLPALALFVVLSSFVGRLQDEDFQTSHYLYPFLFTPVYMTKVNGMAVTFAMNLSYAVVDKPSGYSEKAAGDLLEEYRVAADRARVAVETEQLPNIIVIMDEAFSDLGILGDSFETNVDCMPFVHRLLLGQDNTITGMLNVSVCGGNTANTEFEFLTGNSMAFLPAGSIPYQQYIKEEIPSLASHLKELGYSTCAIHPFNATGWNRDKVYPLLGFERFDSLKNFVSPTMYRSYVSDASDFEKVIQTYESGKDHHPQFIFNVTMQNHGSYTDAFRNFSVDVTSNAGHSFALQQYLSLIRQTDLEFEKLIDYFSQEEERTVVVFFGDHQPADVVVRPVWIVNGVDDRQLTRKQEQLRYQVPYVVWANFDIEEAAGKDTSANYLGMEVLRAAGVPLSDYQMYLEQLQADVPLISAVRREGSEEAVEGYQKIQYYQMFDR